MSDTTAISIIMPIYNMEDSLAQALESILVQTFTAWELIVVDDKSSDKSLSIAHSFARRDTRIRVITLPEQSTEAPSTRGFQESKPETEYIAFLSARDLYFPHFLEKLYRHSQLLDQIDIAFIGSQNPCYSDAWSWIHLMHKKLDHKKHNVRYVQFEHSRSCIRHRSPQEAWSKPIAFHLLCGLNPGAKLYRRGFLEDLQFPESRHFVQAFHWMSCTEASNLLFCDIRAYQHNVEKVLAQAEQVLDVLLRDGQEHFYLLLWMRSLVATFCSNEPKASFLATVSMLHRRMAKLQVLKPTYKLKFSDFRHLHLSFLEIIAWNLLLSRAVKDKVDDQPDKPTSVFLALLNSPVTIYWRAARDRLHWALAKLFL